MGRNVDDHDVHDRTLDLAPHLGDEWLMHGRTHEPHGTAARPAWRVTVRFRPDPPWPISERLEVADVIEDALHAAVGERRSLVLVYSDGLSVAIPVEADDGNRALASAAELLDRVLGAARLRDLGEVRATDVRPWQPSGR